MAAASMADQSLESRTARLESDLAHIRSDIADMKLDIREMRKEMIAMDKRIADLDRKLVHGLMSNRTPAGHDSRNSANDRLHR